MPPEGWEQCESKVWSRLTQRSWSSKLFDDMLDISRQIKMPMEESQNALSALWQEVSSWTSSNLQKPLMVHRENGWDHVKVEWRKGLKTKYRTQNLHRFLWRKHLKDQHIDRPNNPHFGEPVLIVTKDGSSVASVQGTLFWHLPFRSILWIASSKRSFQEEPHLWP